MSFLNGASVEWAPIEQLLFLEWVDIGRKEMRGCDLLKIHEASIKRSDYSVNEVSFFSCQLCQRGKCPGRKARYDENLAREYGLKE